MDDDGIDVLNQDIYGNQKVRPLSKSLSLEPSAPQFNDDDLRFERGLYANSNEEEFIRLLETMKMSHSTRSLLMGYFRMATSDDIVLGNYTVKEADIVYRQLELNLDCEKMKLRGQDMLSWVSGAWDSAASLILSSCHARLNRAIAGWERTALITNRQYVKQDTTNEEKTSSERGGKRGVSALFGR